MSFWGRLARVALIVAVVAAVGAGTLPALLTQSTPTEEAISRIVVVTVPRPSENVQPILVATAPVTVPTMVEPAPPAPIAPVAPVSKEEPPVAPSPTVVASIPTAPEPPSPPTLTEPAPTVTQTEPAPVTTASITPPTPIVDAPAPGAVPEPFPPVQPLTVDATAGNPPSTEQTPPRNLAVATTNAAPRDKLSRKRVANSAHRKYTRRKPFSIGALLAGLRFR